MYSFLSFPHLIFYNPNQSLNLAQYLVELSVHGWRVRGLEADMVHLHLIQRPMRLLKWIISSVPQPRLRTTEEVAGSEGRVGTLHCLGKANVKLVLLPLLFWDGPSYTMGEQSYLPQGFFFFFWCAAIKKKRKMAICAVLSAKAMKAVI